MARRTLSTVYTSVRSSYFSIVKNDYITSTGVNAKIVWIGFDTKTEVNSRDEVDWLEMVQCNTEQL